MSWFKRPEGLDPTIGYVKKGSPEAIEARVCALELEALNRRETEDDSVLKWGGYFLRHVDRREARLGHGYIPEVPEHYTVRPHFKAIPDTTIEVYDFAMYAGLLKHHEKRYKCHS